MAALTAPRPLSPARRKSALAGRRSPRHQRGVAAIEFALVFILFFSLFYAIVGYSLAMLLMQGMTQAAEEGVRAAIAVDPLAYGSDGAYGAAVENAAETRANDALSWLPGKAQEQIVINADHAAHLVTVTITYPNYAGNGMVPTLTLPLIGPVPRLPADLVGQASLQI